MVWDQLTTGETEKINKALPVVILLCATEQHGPHLPLSTDRNIGEHFLEELNRYIRKRGCSPSYDSHRMLRTPHGF